MPFTKKTTKNNNKQQQTKNNKLKKNSQFSINRSDSEFNENSIKNNDKVIF